MKKRIGPQMVQVIRVVAANPGCHKIVPARAVAPYGTGLRFGYRTVDRCIQAGLIEAIPTGSGYKLGLSFGGMQILRDLG